MRVRLLTVSARQPRWVIDGELEYGKRLPREWGFELVELRPHARGKGITVERIRQGEAERVRAALARTPGCRTIALDERGEPWSTAALAERVGRWQQAGRDLAFVIGGADGLAPELLAAADHRWSLSAATLPHGLVRIVVAEQLYRAASVLAGHPYHRS